MLLLVGLGNPGPGYAKNRHNVGFMAVDEIARRHGFGPWRTRFQSAIAEGAVAGEKALLQKPMAYMNRSGLPVATAARFYKLEPGQIIVLYDEIDLAPGKVRVKRGGGHGGHNGIRDLMRHLGPEFRRVRIGVGHPGDKELVEGHVLSDFAKAEWPLFETVLDAVAAELPLLVAGDDGAFMSKVAHRVQPPKPKPEPKPPAEKQAKRERTAAAGDDAPADKSQAGKTGADRT